MGNVLVRLGTTTVVLAPCHLSTLRAVGCRFGPDGRIDIEIQNFKYYHEEDGNPVDLSKIGFFIALTDSEDDLDTDISEVCGTASCSKGGWRPLCGTLNSQAVAGPCVHCSQSQCNNVSSSCPCG
jgi:hypothetical protein